MGWLYLGEAEHYKPNLEPVREAMANMDLLINCGRGFRSDLYCAIRPPGATALASQIR
jgi:hypothetical protein